MLRDKTRRKLKKIILEEKSVVKKLICETRIIIILTLQKLGLFRPAQQKIKLSSSYLLHKIQGTRFLHQRCKDFTNLLHSLPVLITASENVLENDWGSLKETKV